MILSKSVMIYVCNSNIRRYKEMGYNVTSGEYCEIKIEDLPKGSNYKIYVQCDYCNKIYNVKYNICDYYVETNKIEYR